MNSHGVAFGHRQAIPVSDDGLAKVRGTGIAPTNPLARGDVAVILWDEQPKIRPTKTPTRR